MKSTTETLCGLCASLALLAGCNTATPASRANTMRVGDIKITAYEKANLTVTFGDGLLATADGEGDQTANPVQTLDVKPDTDISIPLNKTTTRTATETTNNAAAAES